MADVEAKVDDFIKGLTSEIAALTIAASEDDRVRFISTISECEEICQELVREETFLALDLEGIDLGRTGEICILQLGRLDGRVYLFDICSLQTAAFIGNNLNIVLENPYITKIIYDVRSDCDALKYQYNIIPQGLFDLQILYVLVRATAARYLPGMKRVLDDTLSKEERDRMDAVKTQGVKLFAPEKGGAYEVWKERPLNPLLQQYAGEDVRQLFKIYDKWSCRNAKIVKKVYDKTKKRVANTIEPEVTRQSSAERDF